MKKKYSQLAQSSKQWNEEEDANFWDISYKEDTHTGNKLRSRERKLLKFLDDLNLKKGSKILDLGCGAGITSAKIYSRGYNVIGIDISKPLCDLATKNCEKVKTQDNKAEFIVRNVEKLKFKDNSIDCVIGLGFLQYLEYPNACLKEVYRVLKPEGYFVVTQRNMYGISSLDGPIKLARTLVYLVTNRRYEIRWQDTMLLGPVQLFATLISPFSNLMKKIKDRLERHRKTGKIKKNAFSFNRMKRMLQKADFKIIGYGGAGYLTKKNLLFPNLAKKLDKYFQKMSDINRVEWIHKFGNSTVFLGKKE